MYKDLLNEIDPPFPSPIKNTNKMNGHLLLFAFSVNSNENNANKPNDMK